MENIFDLLTESDLTPDLKILLDVCGMETVKLILKNLNGLNIYVPGIAHLDTLVLKYIRKYSDKTTKQLAFELGVSETYLKKLEKKYKSFSKNNS
ncbi:hypothetical protein D9V86_05190 [Bacteroidetes/Chlorobi group bacterium ChocPot_Mid]|jgi:hypothetical protein|nr:MAG: hypothetical protein D9V86_05190 [Bacteroidetes/Chlorobi group bacterium ChocPot_Mid]